MKAIEALTTEVATREAWYANKKYEEAKVTGTPDDIAAAAFEAWYWEDRAR